MKEINLIKDRDAFFYLKKAINIMYQLDLPIDTKLNLYDVQLKNNIAEFKISKENDLDEKIINTLKIRFNNSVVYLNEQLQGCILVIEEWDKNSQNFKYREKSSYDDAIYLNTKIKNKLINNQYIATGRGSDTYYSREFYPLHKKNLEEKLSELKTFKVINSDYQDLKKEIFKSKVSISLDKLDEYLSLITKKQHREKVKNLIINE